MKTKKLISIAISMILIATLFTGCSGNKSSGEADKRHSYTWWITQMDGLYVNSYDKNPAMDYYSTKTWKDENDKDTKLDFEFLVPAEGTQSDNLNTMISTGDYSDIIDVSLYSGSVNDLYENGITLDLTEYVEKYMPNYKKFLDEHPDLKKTAVNLVDGEQKYLQLYSYQKIIPDQWGGYMYRRDWIVKYGTNQNDGSSFSGEYTDKNEDGTVDLNSWKDNVVFPSGGSDPIYISDWEWMMDIFQKAIEEQGITDGYCISLYYPGYLGTGDLVSAFGGGSPAWYKTKEDKIEFGMTSENFRTYLQCMNTWYKKGWIDKAFQEHATDNFFAIDETKIHQGKVGLWYGLQGQLSGRSDINDGYTKGMVVYGARQPINDMYGTDAQKNIEPYCFYQQGLEGSPIVITEKAKEKDLVALIKFMDHQFSDEGALLKGTGLNKEQYEACQNELYTEFGLTEGAYTVSAEKNEDGLYEIEYSDIIKDKYDIVPAIKGNRLFGLTGIPEGYVMVDHDESENYRNSLNEWIVYSNTGNLSAALTDQLTAENAVIASKTQTNITEFGSKNVPSFITGEKDPFNDTDWQNYVKAIGKYNPDKTTQIYQDLLDQFK